MKYVITLSCFSFLLLTINAQVISKADSASSNYDDRTYTKIANEATFVGGERSWNQFLSNHLMYSNKSKKKYHPQTVVVYFLVEKNGLVRDAKISSRHTDFDDAVLNLMAQSPPWNPATMNGKPVKSIKELQINFNFLGEPIIPIDRLSILDSLKDPHLSDSVYKIVDEPASYSGGQYEWMRFLQKNLIYPEQAQNDNISGTVVIRFIVEKDGNALFPLPISGPEVFYESAIRIMKKSHWNPAKINGKEVNSYHKVSITYHLGQ